MLGLGLGSVEQIRSTLGLVSAEPRRAGLVLGSARSARGFLYILISLSLVMHKNFLQKAFNRIMSDLFQNSQDSLADSDPFAIDPDDSTFSHPSRSVSATRSHERRFFPSRTPTSGACGYFRVTDDAECQERLKGFTV